MVAIDERIAAADALKRLHMVQERMDPEAELAASGDGASISTPLRPTSSPPPVPTASGRHQLRGVACGRAGAPGPEGSRDVTSQAVAGGNQAPVGV